MTHEADGTIWDPAGAQIKNTHHQKKHHGHAAQKKVHNGQRMLNNAFTQISGDEPSTINAGSGSTVDSSFTDMVMGTGSNQEYLEAINRTIELTQL